MKHPLHWLAAATLAATLSLPAVAARPDDTGGGQSNADHGNSANAHAQGSPGSGRGLIVPSRHVYYPGDTLQVRVVYPSSLTAIWNGEAESYIVIHVPGGAAIPVPLTSDIPDSVVSLVELTDLDTSQLTPGDYQLGLVLTVPGGDPLNIDDWYQGFRGLLSVERVRFSETTDPADADGDGEFDNDSDGDGFGDDEALGAGDDEAAGGDTSGGDDSASGDDTSGGDDSASGDSSSDDSSSDDSSSDGSSTDGSSTDGSSDGTTTSN
ncbi:hypothetical protein [Endothiovibrio diazotrophicus]